MLDEEEGHTSTTLMEHVIEAIGLEKYLRHVYKGDEDDFESRCLLPRGASAGGGRSPAE